MIKYRSPDSSDNSQGRQAVIHMNVYDTLMKQK